MDEILKAMPSKALNLTPALRRTKPPRQAKDAALENGLIKTKTQKNQLVLDRRRQMVDAAILIFEAKGFHGATVREIGTAAALTQGTIYNYVQSKEDILFLVCDRIVTDYQARVRAAYLATDDPVAGLKAALRAICTAMVDHRPEIRILYRETHHLTLEAQQIILARIDEFVTEIQKDIADALGVDSPYNIRFLTNIITYLPTMFALRGWVSPQSMRMTKQVDQLVLFLSKGLGLEAD